MTTLSARALGTHLAALCAIALPALGAAAADAAPVTVYVVRGKAVTVPAAGGPEGVYDAGDDLDAAASSAPVAETAAKLRPPTAEVERCGRSKGSAQRACRARNAANKVVLKKLLDTRLVGTRGDGAAVDWSFCRSGLWLSAITSGGSTGLSRDTNWQVEDAVVRQGGRWFDAIVTANRGSSQVAVGMRGGRWKVGVSFGNPASSYGPAERSSASETCAAA
ncbi:hypothetical protein VSS74_29980 [Conexibacter stalactiti]|uniref:Secreted protein n=1 Tax=Conexibacter stalactiti TaxID=1940611 RepID=A0ABU4HZ89_9ACTN|nr:hypothetical protein [Conexibacter stalactiti]MDW5598628.1 hypothetical protein [Conexibacter stalactiti]MEC5039270.1 hypothetical protein [Conexibacter stalactiti]